MDIACPTCATTYEIDDGSVGEAGRKVRCAECATLWRVFRNGAAETISVPEPAAAPAPVAAIAEVPAQEPAGIPMLPEAPPLAPSEADIAASAELPSAAGDIAEIETLPESASSDDAAVIEDTPAPRGRAKITPGGKKAKASSGGGLRKLFSLKLLVIVSALGLMGGAFALRERVVSLVPQSAAVFSAIGAPVNLRGIEIRDVKSRMLDENGVNILVIDGNLVNLRDAVLPIPRIRFAVLGDKGQELYVWSAQADRGNLRAGETLNFRRRLAAPPSDGRDVSVRFLSASDITAGLR
jgi:predicted Zn finger-like uncharacterized protein